MPGWLDRLDDLWDAGFELGRTNVNVALDIATAPFTDDEYEGFFGTVAGISMDYASESMQHLIGPEGLGGVAIGALPPAVRRGGNDTLHALEWAYREGVGEPLATAFTAGSLLEARGRGDDLSGFFDRDLWSEAYGIAQTRSPGQAFTLMFASSENNNILDDEWRIGVEGTRWFSIVSGILDFAARIYLDPTFLGAKAYTVRRAYREGARVAQYFNEGGGFGRFADDVENLVGPGSAAARMADDAARMADDATNVVSMSRAFRMADDAARMVDDAAAAAVEEGIAVSRYTKPQVAPEGGFGSATSRPQGLFVTVDDPLKPSMHAHLAEGGGGIAESGIAKPQNLLDVTGQSAPSHIPGEAGFYATGGGDAAITALHSLVDESTWARLTSFLPEEAALKGLDWAPPWLEALGHRGAYRAADRQMDAFVGRLLADVERMHPDVPFRKMLGIDDVPRSIVGEELGYIIKNRLFTAYAGAQEPTHLILMAVAATEARSRGFDAILKRFPGRDEAFENIDEMVVLSDDVITAAPAAGAARAAGGRTTSEMRDVFDDVGMHQTEMTGRTMDELVARTHPGSGAFIEGAVEKKVAAELWLREQPHRVGRTVDDLEDWAIELTPVDELRVQTQELSESLGRLGGEIRSGNLEGAVRAGDDVSEKAANWYRAYDKEFGPAPEGLPSWMQPYDDAIDDWEYLEFLTPLEETITDVLVQQFGDDVLEQIRALPGAGGVAAAPGAAPAAGAAGATRLSAAARSRAAVDDLSLADVLEETQSIETSLRAKAGRAGDELADDAVFGINMPGGYLDDAQMDAYERVFPDAKRVVAYGPAGGDPHDVMIDAWEDALQRLVDLENRRVLLEAAPAAAPAAGAAGWGGPGAARVHPAFSSKQWGDLTESVPIEFFDDMQGNPGVLAGEVTGGAAGSHRARVDDLVESIREEGIQEPLMLEYNPESGAVWLGEGNHRLAAARELGLDSVPVRAVRHDPLPRGDRLAGKKLHSYGVDEFGDAINASGERLGSAFAPSDVGVPTGVAVPPSGPVAAAAVAAGARSEGVEHLAGRIREKYFPNHGDGDLIAYELAQAVLGEGGYVGGRNSMENVMRFFMGNIHAIRRVAEESPAVATRYSRFLKEALKIEEAVPPGTVGHNARTFQQALDDVPLEMIDEINEPHVTDLWHSIDEAIRPTVRRNTIDRVNTSAWYRSHWSMAPVRLVRDMRPQHIVWAGDANSGEQVVRLMQEAGRHPDDITRFRGRWAGAERRERVHIFQEEQANMIDDLLERHFPDADESVRAALRKDFTDSNAAADRALSTAKRYDAQLSTVAVPQADGSIQMFQVPMTPGQLEQSFTMVDIKTLDRFLAHRASIIPDGVFSSKEIAGAWMNGTMGVWKAAALLRPAWTVRVVLDEQLRMIAKMGAWTRMHGILANDRHRYVEAVLARKVVKDGVVDRGSAAWLRSRRAAVAGGVGALLAGPAGAAIGAGASFVRNRRAIRRLTRKLEVKRAAREIGGRAGQARLADDSLTAHGEAPSQIGAHEVQGAFGDAVAPQVVWERSVSANRQVSFALGHEERALYDELRTTYGSWVEVNPLEFRADEFSERVSRYGDGWERVVNDQYASNQAGRIAFDDSLGGPQERVDRLIEWADTDKGRQFVAATPKRFPTDEFGVFAPADVEDWAKKLVEAADRMVLDRTIRGRLAAGERVRFADVQAIAGDAGQDWRYLVGEIHAQDMVAAKGGLKGPLDRLRGFTEKAFERLGTLPTDTLSRNPYFRHVYETGMERRLKSLDASDLRIHGQQYELSDEALRGMEGSARREALQETRYLLYDLAESSQFAHMFRHMMPFYNAWQEVLSRWAGIAIENPAYVARLGAGLRADIDIDGFMETVEVDGERFYQFRLPEFATSLLSSGFFSGAANDLGIVRFRADSLNMVTQGLPGFGPMAQVPASMLVTEQPELEGALRFVLPYGPIKGTNIVEQAKESFKPAWLKRITSSLEEDRSYESMAAKIMISRLADMQNGEREQIDFDDANVRAEFIAEVRTDAQHFMYLRAMASAVSPAAIGFHSPYQPWIDRHRELRSANPVTADEEFLKELSREGVGGFFVMSARFSKNNEGLPATLESEELRNKYIDLVRRYPEVGGLILGIEGGGAARFSSSVYEKQLAEDTSPGSGKKRRERLSLDEIMVSAREREGWSKYGEVSDVVYNEMRRRGLPNLRVKEARDLLWVKQVAVLKLGEEYPLWYAAFRDPDLTKWSDRLEGMRAIVSDERLSGRDDVRLLAEYLEIRDLFTGELLRRGVAGGAVTLEATSNMDLSGLWEQVMDVLLENPTFSDLLWRWLEFDPLKSETWPTRQRTALQASRLARMAA